MRGRRPELFSDSLILQTPTITREQLDYHLETLTARKLEIAFEHFCRELAQREICPNLIPQTGPTGGGDSKVDSETYPVSDEISLRWYHAKAEQAGRQRWAFAFSAKKDWAGKVRSDFRGIAKTGRRYDLVYFISNQLIPDKQRAAKEEQLSVELDIPLRILDRSWILDRVFLNHHLELAARTLGLDEESAKTVVTPGPHDIERAGELAALEKHLSDPLVYKDHPSLLAEGFLDSALLARGLGRPRHDVEARFERARRLAEDCGAKQLLPRILYDYAWTTFWWFDDSVGTSYLYDTLEALSIDSHDAGALERLCNLLSCLHSSTHRRALRACESIGDRP